MKPELTLVIGNKNYSSWSLRAWYFLERSGLPFKEIRIALNSPGYKERILEHSPTGKVPLLRDGSTIVWDSLAICEYLAEAYPEIAAWPQDRITRARARSASAEMHSGFPALREAMPMNCRARGRKVPVTDALAGDIARIKQIWTECRTENADAGPWLFGSFSVADAMFAPVVARFITYGVEREGEVAGYVETLWNDPAIERWVEQSQAETEVIEAEEVGQ